MPRGIGPIFLGFYQHENLDILLFQAILELLPNVLYKNSHQIVSHLKQMYPLNFLIAVLQKLDYCFRQIRLSGCCGRFDEQDKVWREVDVLEII